MLSNAFTKTIRDNLRATIAWTAGAAVLSLWLASMYPYIRDSEEMKKLLEQIPPEVMAAFGMDPATFLTGAGYLSGQLYSFIGPIIMIGFAVSLGAAITATEEKDGTLDMLLSAPISRTHVVLSRFAAVALLAAFVPAAMAVVLLVGNGPFGLRLSVQGILAVNVGLWLLGMVYASIAAATGSLTGQPGTARGVALSAAVLAWFVSVFAPFFGWLDLPSKGSPFTWYIDENPMLELWSTGLGWLVISSGALGAAAVWLFARRDIATELSVFPETRLTPRRSRHVLPRSVWLLGSVAGKTVWDRRRTIFMWAAGIASPLLITFSAWPALSANATAMAAMIGAMPSEIFAVFGMTDPEALATPAGFISSRAYVNIGPLIMIIFCVGGVSTLVAKEEQAGTLDMLLSNPMHRRSVLGAKVATLGGLAVLIAAFLTAVAFVGNEIWDTALEPMHIIGANVGLMLLGVFFGGMSLALWSFLGSGGAAVGITSAVAVGTYFLNGLATIVNPIAPLRILSPFFWYLGDTAPLAKGPQPAYLLLLLGGVAGSAIAAWRFNTRDLAV